MSTIDDTTSNPAAFDPARSKTEMRMMLAGARILLAIFGAGGLGLLATAGPDIDQEPTIRGFGLTLLTLAGVMTIAAGALRGHLTILRAVEQEKVETIQAVEDLRDDLGGLLSDVADAAMDELRKRRDQD